MFTDAIFHILTVVVVVTVKCSWLRRANKKRLRVGKRSSVGVTFFWDATCSSLEKGIKLEKKKKEITIFQEKAFFVFHPLLPPFSATQSLCLSALLSVSKKITRLFLFNASTFILTLHVRKRRKKKNIQLPYRHIRLIPF